MRFKQSITAALAAVAGVAISAGVPASAAQAATTTVTLPIAKYSHMLLDPAHQHLFFSSGSGSTSILVTDYSGQTVATIPNEPGATGLALSADGSTVYAALADGDAVSAISTSTLAETARYTIGTTAIPYYVAYSSGKIWFGYNGAPFGGIGSIDPSTSPATVTLGTTGDRWNAAPMLTATPGGELVAGEPGQSPVQLASYDVSSGGAVVLAPQKSLTEAANLESMQITPDGTDVVLASGSPSYHEIYQVSGLSAVGTYPTTNYPDSVAIAADGTVAAGTSSTNEVFMFAPGGSTPLNTVALTGGAILLDDDGVAITPDASLLFAVTTNAANQAVQLNIVSDPTRPAQDPTSTAVTCAPATAAPGQAVTCTATVTDTASSGATTPTGTVSFGSTVSGGSFSAGSCTLSPAAASGQASCSVSYTTPQATGADTIIGNYGGDGSHAASRGQAALTVTLSPTTTVLTCQRVLALTDRCTATVSNTAPGTAAAPTGTVTFTSSRHGIFSATTCTLSVSGSSASCSVRYTRLLGSQTLTASYGGDSTHQASAGSTTLK
jgi:Bacterial Ig-like domain (group 3)